MLHTLHKEDYETPLTKKKNKKLEVTAQGAIMGKKSEVFSPETDDELSLESLEITPPKIEVVAKPKKPRSEKQIEAFKNAQINRQNNILLKKENQKVEAAKLLLNEKPVVPIKKVKEVVDSSSDENEEEVIIVQKRKKPKPKVKRIIVEQSESESESEEEEVKHKEKPFKSQQNKRSIKVSNNPHVSPTTCFLYKIII